MKTSKIEAIEGVPYDLTCRMESKSAAAVYPVSILFDSTAKSTSNVFIPSNSSIMKARVTEVLAFRNVFAYTNQENNNLNQLIAQFAETI